LCELSFLSFFFAIVRFEFRAFTLSHCTSPFLWWFFLARVLQTICLGWLWTVSLLIYASWVARITGVSHWHFLILLKFVIVWILNIPQKLKAWTPGDAIRRWWNFKGGA
jgi:hypothetical protein